MLVCDVLMLAWLGTALRAAHLTATLLEMRRLALRMVEASAAAPVRVSTAHPHLHCLADDLGAADVTTEWSCQHAD